MVRIYVRNFKYRNHGGEIRRGLSSWWQLLDVTTSTFYPQDGHLQDAPVAWPGQKNNDRNCAADDDGVMSRFPNRWGTGGGESGL